MLLYYSKIRKSDLKHFKMKTLLHLLRISVAYKCTMENRHRYMDRTNRCRENNSQIVCDCEVFDTLLYDLLFEKYCTKQN